MPQMPEDCMMGLMRGVQEELPLQQKRALQEPVSGTNQGGIDCACLYH